MTIDISRRQTAEILWDRDSILLLCHKNPDGDTLGSAAALACALISMGKRCAVACHHEIPPKFAYLDIPVYVGDFEPEFIVAVDVASAGLLGASLEKYRDRVDLCIDHHASNTGYSARRCLAGHYPAAAQLVYEILGEMGAQITPHIADCLYTGIITDTGCFMYSSTMPETHIAAAQLMEKGADYIHLNERFFMQKSARTVELEKFALNNYEYYFDRRAVLLFVDRRALCEIQPSVTDMDGLASVARGFEGVEISVLFRRIGENVYKCSIRTGEGADASLIAAHFSGGGHLRAAGCEIKGEQEEIRQAILKEIGKQLCHKTATE